MVNKKVLRYVLPITLLLILVVTACTNPSPTAAPAPAAPAPAAPAPAPAAAPPAAAPGKVYNWNLFSAYTPADWPHRQIPGIIKNLEVATGGAMKIKLFARGEHPYAGADMLQVVKERKAEVVQSFSGWVSGAEPLANVYGLPLFLPSKLEDLEKVFGATADQVLGPMYDRWNGVRLLSYFWPPQRFHTKVPVTSFDSLKNKRIRGSSPELAEVVNLMNGIGVMVDWGEVPTALATGVIDGVITSVGSTYDFGIYQYVSVLNLFDLASSNGDFVVNKSALAELDEATRNAFLKVWADSQHTMMEGSMVDAWKKTELLVSEFGATIVAPNAKFRDEVKDKVKSTIWTKWAQRAGPQGQAAIDLIQEALKKL
ncbi:MAG: TRAP transporter substrate-binding protein DctP [Chloroflexi bacterium]|nr:TRAP transporter substrate-binding protein DctP [Chloroflexota bacterium]